MDFTLISNAFAEGAPAQAANPFGSFVPLILIFFVFYFLVLKPQQKRLKEEKSMIMAIKKGDEVYTKSGILGTISGLTEKIITLEISEGVKVKVLKTQVGGLASKVFETAPTPAKK